MDPVGAGLLLGGVVVVLLGLAVAWWMVRAAVSMVKRILALGFVLGLAGVLVAAAGFAFSAAR